MDSQHSTLMKISDIIVGNRYRQDMGDLAGLAKSIRAVGFLQPVVVTQANQLVAGARRLEAAKELGLRSVPVRIVENLGDALLLLTAERDENTCRKDFTASEAVSLGKAIEDLERPKARARQEATRAKPGEKVGSKGERNLRSPSETGKTSRKVAEAVGMKERTYEKAKAVVEAAEKEPELFGDLPEKMDKGKVDPAFKEMKARQKMAEKAPQVGPKSSAGEEDAQKFITLRNKLYPRWQTDWDKQVMRQCFRQMANEV